MSCRSCHHCVDKNEIVFPAGVHEITLFRGIGRPIKVFIDASAGED